MASTTGAASWDQLARLLPSKEAPEHLGMVSQLAREYFWSEETDGMAARLQEHDTVTEAFGTGQVWLDVAGLPPVTNQAHDKALFSRFMDVYIRWKLIKGKSDKKLPRESVGTKFDSKAYDVAAAQAKALWKLYLEARGSGKERAEAADLLPPPWMPAPPRYSETTDWAALWLECRTCRTTGTVPPPDRTRAEMTDIKARDVTQRIGKGSASASANLDQFLRDQDRIQDLMMASQLSDEDRNRLAATDADQQEFASMLSETQFRFLKKPPGKASVFVASAEANNGRFFGLCPAWLEKTAAESRDSADIDNLTNQVWLNYGSMIAGWSALEHQLQVEQIKRHVRLQYGLTHDPESLFTQDQRVCKGAKVAEHVFAKIFQRRQAATRGGRAVSCEFMVKTHDASMDAVSDTADRHEVRATPFTTAGDTKSRMASLISASGKAAAIMRFVQNHDETATQMGRLHAEHDRRRQASQRRESQQKARILQLEQDYKNLKDKADATKQNGLSTKPDATELMAQQVGQTNLVNEVSVQANHVQLARESLVKDKRLLRHLKFQDEKGGHEFVEHAKNPIPLDTLEEVVNASTEVAQCTNLGLRDDVVMHIVRGLLSRALQQWADTRASKHSSCRDPKVSMKRHGKKLKHDTFKRWFKALRRDNFPNLETLSVWRYGQFGNWSIYDVLDELEVKSKEAVLQKLQTLFDEVNANTPMLSKAGCDVQVTTWMCKCSQHNDAWYRLKQSHQKALPWRERVKNFFDFCAKKSKLNDQNQIDEAKCIEMRNADNNGTVTTGTVAGMHGTQGKPNKPPAGMFPNCPRCQGHGHTADECHIDDCAAAHAKTMLDASRGGLESMSPYVRQIYEGVRSGKPPIPHFVGPGKLFKTEDKAHCPICKQLGLQENHWKVCCTRKVPVHKLPSTKRGAENSSSRSGKRNKTAHNNRDAASPASTAAATKEAELLAAMQLKIKRLKKRLKTAKAGKSNSDSG